MQRIAGVLVASVAAASIGLAVPAAAQDQPTTTGPVKYTTTKKRQPPPQVTANRPPPTARVVVRKRSYLDPGTEIKTHDDHHFDYAYPTSNSRNGMDIFLNRYDITFTNNPIPSCLDLAGFCR